MLIPACKVWILMCIICLAGNSYALPSTWLVDANGTATCKLTPPLSNCAVYSNTNASLTSSQGLADGLVLAGWQLLTIHGELHLDQTGNGTGYDISALRSIDNEKLRSVVDLGQANAGFVVLATDAILVFENLVLMGAYMASTVKFANSSGERAFNQLQPFVFSMQQGSMLVMHNVSIVTTCDVVSAHSADACTSVSVHSTYEVGIGWVNIRSMQLKNQDGASIIADNVNITCPLAATSPLAPGLYQPCLARQAQTGAEVVAMVREASSRWAPALNSSAPTEHSLYIALDRNISFSDNTLGTQPPFASVQGYTLVLEAGPALPEPPLVDLGNTAGIISLTPASDDSLVSGLQAGLLRLRGLILYNLPPGRPDLYPYSLATALVWSFDFDRPIGTYTTAQPIAGQVEIVNCTLVVPNEEAWILATWLGNSPGTDSLKAPQDWLFRTMFSSAQLLRWSFDGARQLYNTLQLSSLVGIMGTWGMYNVTVATPTAALPSDRGLRIAESYLTPVITSGGLLIANYNNISDQQVLKPPAKLTPADFADDRFTVLRSAYGLRILVPFDAQVDAPAWQAAPVTLGLNKGVSICGDPVNNSRVHLDLMGQASALGSANGMALLVNANVIQLRSLVLLNPGPLPPDQVNALPRPARTRSLTAEDRLALSNFTSMLWFFNLSQTTSVYTSSNDRLLLLVNVALVLPDLEIQALAELASTGATNVNIPQAAEELLSQCLPTSYGMRRLSYPPGAVSFSFFRSIQYTGKDLTLVPASWYTSHSPYPLVNYSESLQLTVPGQPALKNMPLKPPPRIPVSAPRRPQLPPGIPTAPAATVIITGDSAAHAAVATIVGTAAGTVVALAIVVAAFAVYRKRRMRRQREQQQQRAQLKGCGSCANSSLDGPMNPWSIPSEITAMGTTSSAVLIEIREGGWQLGAVGAPGPAGTQDQQQQQQQHDAPALQQQPSDSAQRRRASSRPVSGKEPASRPGSEKGSASRPGSEKAPSGSRPASGKESGSRPGSWKASGSRPSSRRGSGKVSGSGSRVLPTDDEQPPQAAADAEQQGVSAAQSDRIRRRGGRLTEAEQKLLDDMRAALALLPESGDQLADVEVEGVLGKGSSATVFRGTWKGVPVAIKRFLFQPVARPDGMPGTMQQYIMQEAAINASLNHKNVIKTFGYGIKPLTGRSNNKFGGQQAVACGGGDSGALLQDWQLFLIQELCEERSLHDAITRNRFFDTSTGRPDMFQVLNICVDILSGLSYLHGRGLVHADVKPDNILLVVSDEDASVDQGAGAASSSAAPPQGEIVPDQAQGVNATADVDDGISQPVTEAGSKSTVTAKLADFGLSVLTAGRSHVSGVKHGTPLYMAPEVVDRAHASHASDVYATGVIMWEMYHGRTAWNQLMKHIYAGASPPRYGNISTLFGFTEHHTMPEFEQLATACMSHDKGARPTTAACLAALESMLASLSSKRSA